MTKKKSLLGEAALLTAAFIWGTSFVLLKETLNSVPTLWVLAIRFTISSVIIMAVAVKRLKYMSRKSIGGSILLGIFLAAAYIFQTYGLVYTTPGKNAFLATTYCVMVPFLLWVFFKSRPTAMNMVGAFLCLVGIGMVSLSSGFDDVNFGDVLTLISGIFYSMQIIMMGYYNTGDDPLSISGIQFCTSAVICWIGAAIFEAPPQNVPMSAWGSIAYLGVMCTGLCFYLEAWGLHYTPAPVASVLLTFESVFGALISILFYDEELTAPIAIGFVIIFASVLVSQYVPKAKSSKTLKP